MAEGAVPVEMTTAPVAVPILYRDEAIVVVDKPTGMPVHRGAGHHGDVVMTLVRDAIGQWVYPVHRLDAPTSGVMAFALSSEHAAALQGAFEARLVQKRYLALVLGEVPDAGVLDSPMRRNKTKKGGPEVESITEYERLFVTPWSGPEGALSLVSVTPKTGRQHQIRRHFRRFHHALAGDVSYGRGPKNQLLRDELGLHRLALHAVAITLPHPVTDEAMTFTADIPEDLRAPFLRAGIPEEVLDVTSLRTNR